LEASLDSFTDLAIVRQQIVEKGFNSIAIGFTGWAPGQ
jgi:hypothetical protein